jgi:transposase
LSGRETAITTIAHAEPIRVTVGVDTHGEVHVACAIDQLGRHLATTRFATTPTGYRALLGWARSLGEVEGWCIEGTGCYGAGLARLPDGQGQVVREATGQTAKPNVGGQVRPGRRRGRCSGGASWPGNCRPQDWRPGGDGAVPTGGPGTAIKARTQAANALRALVVTAPAELREELRDLPTGRLASTAARRRQGRS